jgi:pilus assembly protein CpaE
MLRSFIFGRDQALAEQIQKLLWELGFDNGTRILDRYPGNHEVPSLVRGHAPHLIFLDLQAMDRALDVVAAVNETAPGTPIVSFSKTFDSATLLPLMRAGVRDFLQYPFRREALTEVLERIGNLIGKQPPPIRSTDLFLAFVPSKGGAGASTLAMNLSLALARSPQKKVLLVDADLHSGLIKFYLRLEKPYSILHATQQALELDDELWAELVSPAHGLDVLPAGRPTTGNHLQCAQLQPMIDFALRNYDLVTVDLPESLESHAMEVLSQSRRVYLVCTPELPSLHLARQKAQFLESMNLGDRIQVLLNRFSKRSTLTVSHVEDILGRRVAMVFANDYEAVQKSQSAAAPIDPASELGRQICAFAGTILPTAPNTPKAPERQPHKFLEHFFLVPGRKGMEARRQEG